MNNSNMNESFVYSWKPDSLVRNTVQLVLMIVIGGIGILTNIFIIVLAVEYTVRTTLHHLIANMAVSDSMVIIMKFVDWISTKI